VRLKANDFEAENCKSQSKVTGKIYKGKSKVFTPNGSVATGMSECGESCDNILRKIRAIIK